MPISNYKHNNITKLQKTNQNNGIMNKTGLDGKPESGGKIGISKNDVKHMKNLTRRSNLQIQNKQRMMNVSRDNVSQTDPIKHIKDKKPLYGDDIYNKVDNVPDSIGSDEPDDYNKIILDQTGNRKSGQVCHFRKPRVTLDEHPLNSYYKEDFADVASKGLMLGGTAIVLNGVDKTINPYYRPIFRGATLLGAGVLIYKLTDQDIKKFYKNYVSRLEGNYENLISYNDYKQFVKKYNFKYTEDYYKLNDILAGKSDPIEMEEFMKLNRYNLNGMNTNSLINFGG